MPIKDLKTEKPYRGLNHIDLGPYHGNVIAHVKKLADNLDLFLNPLSPPEEATLNGKQFSDQYAVDCAHMILVKCPYEDTKLLLVGYLKPTIPTWERFSSEFVEGVYHWNNTEAFVEANFTKEDDLYVMRLARVEDANGAMHKFREELLALKQKVAAIACQKQADKVEAAAAEINNCILAFSTQSLYCVAID
ncbi:hypothetical protein FB451DRAFT_1169629 [Mycena latifolia]|nr:hypothetical protein FB451DRAFT_1169629 [Mycena latifolia]